MGEREEFARAWRELERLGMCDGAGGVEYRRVLNEWRQIGRFASMLAFIRRRANLLSDGSESPEVLPRP